MRSLLDLEDIHVPGGPYWGRTDFILDQRTLVLDGVGGHQHPRGQRWGFLDWDCPGLKHAVHIDGTLNKRDDTDRGWYAEIAIPWASLALLSAGRPLPPSHGDVCVSTAHGSRRSAEIEKFSIPVPDGRGTVMGTTTLISRKCFPRSRSQQKSAAKLRSSPAATGALYFF